MLVLRLMLVVPVFLECQGAAARCLVQAHILQSWPIDMQRCSHLREQVAHAVNVGFKACEAIPLLGLPTHGQETLTLTSHHRPTGVDIFGDYSLYYVDADLAISVIVDVSEVSFPPAQEINRGLRLPQGNHRPGDVLLKITKLTHKP